jgi:hypothetical protein
MLAWLATAGSAGAAEVADYQFQNDLHSSIAGAPDLAVIGAGTGYATESVYNTNRVVLTHAIDSGLALTPTTSILADPGIYSILMRVRHVASPTSYAKYVDVANGTMDEGLYDDGGHLRFYSYGYGLDQPVTADYVDIAVTRNAAGAMAGYVNGVPEFAVDDSVNPIGIVNNANILRFVYDDDTTNNTESAAGAVARIRIWNTALTAAEIKVVSESIFVNGFEATP